MERRQFLHSSGLAAASAARVLGANDKIRLALIGCGGRGRYVSNFMKEDPGVEFVSACDVYQPNAAAAAKVFGPQCTTESDFRRVLERKDVDAVVVGTPDHWHAAVTVLACRAAKDVYTEKPLTHNIREGRQLADEARKSGRIVQAGLQHRSAPHFAECAELIRAGELGSVHFVRIWNCINMTPNGIGNVPDSEPPAGLDWNFYCGPAPLRPYNKLRHLSTYRWFWDYSGGFITDFGAHRFGTVHHLMNVTAPRSINAFGRRFAVNDIGETPDVLQVSYEYDGFVLTYEGLNMSGMGLPRSASGLNYYGARGDYNRPNGMAFHGTKGTLFCDRLGYEFYPDIDYGSVWPPVRIPTEIKYRGVAKKKQGADATRLHALSFVENVRNRRKPEADAEFGHRVTSAALLGNISYKLGVRLKWDAERETFLDSPPEAYAMLGRQARKPWDLI
jgi:predicted dehydrogenase